MRQCVWVLLWACIAASNASAQAPSQEWFKVTTVGPNTYAVVDNPAAKQRAWANAGFVVGDDGVIVIDTLTGDDASGAMLAAIRTVTKLPIKFVVNTHYHGDHVAGNRAFVGAGATVLAHRNVRGWIHPENLRMLGPNPQPDLKLFVERLVAPTVGYTDGIDLHVGKQSVLVRYFPGHTGGDSVVVVPDARVVFGGDLIWRDCVPNMIDASTKPWIATLDSLATTYPKHTFIPGHGDVAQVEHVRAFRDYLATLMGLVTEARAKDPSLETITRSVLPTLEGRFGKWEGFKNLAPLNIAQMTEELAGKKSVPRQ